LGWEHSTFDSNNLFASWFHGGRSQEVGGQIIGGKCLDVHFYETHKRAAEIRPFPAAAIDDYADASDFASE
jgi:hypothetical protein